MAPYCKVFLDPGLRRDDGRNNRNRFKFKVLTACCPNVFCGNLSEELFTSCDFRSIFGYPQGEKERYTELSALSESRHERGEFADGAKF